MAGIDVVPDHNTDWLSSCLNGGVRIPFGERIGERIVSQDDCNTSLCLHGSRDCSEERPYLMNEVFGKVFLPT